MHDLPSATALENNKKGLEAQAERSRREDLQTPRYASMPGPTPGQAGTLSKFAVEQATLVGAQDRDVATLRELINALEDAAKRPLQRLGRHLGVEVLKPPTVYVECFLLAAAGVVEGWTLKEPLVTLFNSAGGWLLAFALPVLVAALSGAFAVQAVRASELDGWDGRRAGKVAVGFAAVVFAIGSLGVLARIDTVGYASDAVSSGIDSMGTAAFIVYQLVFAAASLLVSWHVAHRVELARRAGIDATLLKLRSIFTGLPELHRQQLAELTALVNHLLVSCLLSLVNNHPSIEARVEWQDRLRLELESGMQPVERYAGGGVPHSPAQPPAAPLPPGPEAGGTGEGETERPAEPPTEPSTGPPAPQSEERPAPPRAPVRVPSEETFDSILNCWDGEV